MNIFRKFIPAVTAAVALSGCSPSSGPEKRAPETPDLTEDRLPQRPSEPPQTEVSRESQSEDLLSQRTSEPDIPTITIVGKTERFVRATPLGSVEYTKVDSWLPNASVLSWEQRGALSVSEALRFVRTTLQEQVYDSTLFESLNEKNRTLGPADLRTVKVVIPIGSLSDWVWTSHFVQKGEDWATIALNYGVPIGLLKGINNAEEDERAPKVGSTVDLPALRYVRIKDSVKGSTIHPTISGVSIYDRNQLVPLVRELIDPSLGASKAAQCSAAWQYLSAQDRFVLLENLRAVVSDSQYLTQFIPKDRVVAAQWSGVLADIPRAIHNPFRLTVATAAQIVKAQRELDEGKFKLFTPAEREKTALIVAPYGDSNGAFARDNKRVEQLLAAGYKVIFVQADGWRSAAAAVSGFIKKAGYSPALRVFCGHGDPKGVTFGFSEIASNYADLTTDNRAALALWAELGREMKGAAGRNIFFACSTGRREDGRESIAEVLSSILPGVTYAPVEDTFDEGFEFDSKGRVCGVVYAGKESKRIPTRTFQHRPRGKR